MMQDTVTSSVNILPNIWQTGATTIVDVLAQDSLANTNVLVETIEIGVEGTPISYRMSMDNGITAILFFCFLLTSYVLAFGKRGLIQQVKDFYHIKERSSMFTDSTADDFRYRLLLLLQTCILLGIFVFYYFNESIPEIQIQNATFLVVAVYSIVFIGYFLIKWGLYVFLSWIFFDKTRASIHVESYIFIISAFGILLFPLILFTVYFDLSLKIVIILGLGMIIFAKILFFAKSIKLFFENIYGLFCLIVYFCALEIMPCFVLYQALDQVNNLLIIKL